MSKKIKETTIVLILLALLILLILLSLTCEYIEQNEKRDKFLNDLKLRKQYNYYVDNEAHLCELSYGFIDMPCQSGDIVSADDFNKPCYKNKNMLILKDLNTSQMIYFKEYDPNYRYYQKIYYCDKRRYNSYCVENYCDNFCIESYRFEIENCLMKEPSLGIFKCKDFIRIEKTTENEKYEEPYILVFFNQLTMNYLNITLISNFTIN